MNVLIVDGEPLVHEHLNRLLGRLDGYRVVETLAGSGEQALERIERLKPDVALIDIGIEAPDALQLAAALCGQDVAPALVFLVGEGSSAERELLREQGMVLLDKRASAQALEQALATAVRPTRSQLAALVRAPQVERSQQRTHVGARTRKGYELVRVEDILYFIADHKYVTLCHAQGEMLLDEPLKSLEAEFGERFVRIHRNALVARDRIERLSRSTQGHFQVYLRGLGEQQALTVSRRHVPGVRRLMEPA